MFKINKFIALIFLLIKSNELLGQTLSIEKNTDITLHTQELLFEKNQFLIFDSIANIINNLSFKKTDSKSKELFIKALYAHYYLNEGSKAGLEKAIHYYDSCVNLAQTHNYYLSQATFLHQQGIGYYKFGEYAKGLEYMLRANWMMNDIGYDKIQNISAYLYDLAYAHAYYFEDFNHALQFSSTAHQYLNHSKWDQYELYNLSGLLYRQLRKMDSSDYYFKTALQLAKRQNHPKAIGDITGNIGYNYFLSQKYDSARICFEKDMEMAIEVKNWSSAGLSSLFLAKISFLFNDELKGDSLLQYSRGLIDSIKLYGDKKAYYMATYTYYQELFQRTKQQKHYINQIAYQDSILKYNDSLWQTRDIKSILPIQIDLIKESANNQMKILKSENEKRVWIQNTAIVFCLILILYSFKYIYDLKQRRKQDENRINNLLYNINEKNNIIEQFQKSNTQQIQSDQLSVSSNQKEETLQRLRELPVHTPTDWEHFKAEFETIYPLFFEEVNLKIPNISPSELRFLCFTQLGFSSKLIAERLGITQESLRKLRYRLRKKIDENLKYSHADLFDFKIK